MVLEVSHGEQLKTGSTFETCDRMFGHAFLPVNWFSLGFLCDHGNTAMTLFLGFESHVRIPRISATQSTGMLPRNPWECCHAIHGNVATQSTGFLPPSPREV